jgi:hypothetical protein
MIWARGREIFDQPTARRILAELSERSGIGSNSQRAVGRRVYRIAVPNRGESR